MDSMPATVMLAIVLPVLGGILVVLLTMNGRVGRLAAALLGVEGQGGALNKVEELRKRVHKLESLMTAVMVHSGIEMPARRADDE